MRVEAPLARASLTGTSGYRAHCQTSHSGSRSNLGPNFLRQETQIASTIVLRQRKSTTLLANPANRSLVKVNRDRLGDLHAPATVFLLPELRRNPKPYECVMHVLG